MALPYNLRTHLSEQLPAVQHLELQRILEKMPVLVPSPTFWDAYIRTSWWGMAFYWDGDAWVLYGLAHAPNAAWRHKRGAFKCDKIFNLNPKDVAAAIKSIAAEERMQCVT